MLHNLAHCQFVRYRPDPGHYPAHSLSECNNMRVCVCAKTKYPSATLPKNWGFKESSISSNAFAFAFDVAFAFAFAVASALLMVLRLLGVVFALPSHTHTHVIAFAKLS